VTLYPVSLVIFYHWSSDLELSLWTQVRTDDGPFHGLLEFPGGGVESYETPLQAAIREVEEEVGLRLADEDLNFMGIYQNLAKNKNILLYVFLSQKTSELMNKGTWLKVEKKNLSQPHEGKIPGPNHRIIDDLFNYFWKNKNE
jgi:mutator protein MutT